MADQMNLFDVLVVYSHKIATSASFPDSKLKNKYPFSIESKRFHYNKVYAYFLKTCAQLGLKAAFTTSADIVGTGMCNTYWLYEKERWLKKYNLCFSNIIFDKFFPADYSQRKNRRLLFSSPEIRSFSDPYLFKLFFDKIKTFKQFRKSSIPTVAITKNKPAEIRLAISKLKELIDSQKQKADFGKEIILKDRFGSGGYNIYKINDNFAENIFKIIKNKRNFFIVQPFLLFDKGFQYKNAQELIDIRLIFMGKKIIQTYIRKAKKNDFRCNEHQGGSLIYVHKQTIPLKVIKLAHSLADKLNKPHFLYALDFVISNSGNVYFLEGNCNPGLDWNLALPKNERESKKLIRIVVEELKNRVQTVRPKKTILLPVLNHYLIEVARAGIEPANNGFKGRCLTTWRPGK